MNLFLIGSTGRTGRHVLGQAIGRGHRVTSIVRRPELQNRQEGAEVVVGDPLSAAGLASAIQGHDAIISCLGQRSRNDAELLRNAAAATLEAMAATQVRRYIVVSQALLFPSRNPIVALLRLILARHVADSVAMERLVCASDADWTIVRPPRLLDGGAGSGYRAAVDRLPPGSQSMQRSDLASFLLDEMSKREHVRTIVGVTSP